MKERIASQIVYPMLYALCPLPQTYAPCSMPKTLSCPPEALSHVPCAVMKFGRYGLMTRMKRHD